MISPFVSRRRFPFGELGGGVVSAAAHVALIALAIAAQASRAADKVYGATREKVVWVDAARWAPARPRVAEGGAVARTRPRTTRPKGALPPLQFSPTQLADLTAVPPMAPVTADVDLTAIASDVDGAFGATDGADGIVGQLTGRAYRKASSNTLYSEETVERIAAPAPRNPTPRYPPALVMMQVEGTFVVRFVVDTTGLVEPSSLEFPAEMHEYFVKAVRSALLRSHYYPAEVGGQPVRQLVQQTFSFVIATPK